MDRAPRDPVPRGHAVRDDDGFEETAGGVPVLVAPLFFGLPTFVSQTSVDHPPLNKYPVTSADQGEKKWTLQRMGDDFERDVRVQQCGRRGVSSELGFVWHGPALRGEYDHGVGPTAAVCCHQYRSSGASQFRLQAEDLERTDHELRLRLHRANQGQGRALNQGVSCSLCVPESDEKGGVEPTDRFRHGECTTSTSRFDQRPPTTSEVTGALIGPWSTLDVVTSRPAHDHTRSEQPTSG